jgi:hypothetical protein
VDHVDGIEWRIGGRISEEVETHGADVIYAGRVYRPDRNGYPETEGTYFFDAAPVDSLKPGGHGSLVLRVCGDGFRLWLEGGRVIDAPPDFRESGDSLTVTHAGGVYEAGRGGFPAPGDYPFSRVRDERGPREGISVADWWEREKQEMYSPEMCEAYRDAALLMRAAGREIHPDYWRGVPEAYWV